MATIIKLKRGNGNPPRLLEGEIAYSRNNKLLEIGTGSTKNVTIGTHKIVCNRIVAPILIDANIIRFPLSTDFPDGAEKVLLPTLNTTLTKICSINGINTTDLTGFTLAIESTPNNRYHYLRATKNNHGLTLTNCLAMVQYSLDLRYPNE